MLPCGRVVHAGRATAAAAALPWLALLPRWVRRPVAGCSPAYPSDGMAAWLVAAWQADKPNNVAVKQHLGVVCSCLGMRFVCWWWAPAISPHPSSLSCSPSSLQVLRLSSQDVPTSYAYDLEAATIVQVRACLRLQAAAPVVCSALEPCCMQLVACGKACSLRQAPQVVSASTRAHALNRPPLALSALQPEKVVEAVHKICGVRAGV